MEVLEEKEEVEQAAEDLNALRMSENFQDAEEKVSVEQVSVPSDVPDFDWSSIDTSLLPSSYKTNSPKEKKLLHMADHFLQQYTHLCPDHKPLFLHPVNECGVEKFVSTTLRPTLLPYPELYDWSGCASFVSGYLTMEPLKCPISPPSSLYSPTTILKYQRGNCFDFTMLLCSMLIGAGYDAYCVHGYATREICTLDQTQELCPLLRKPQEVPKEEMKSSKCEVRFQLDLQSKFELQQKVKQKEEIEAAQKKEREEEMAMEVEKPKPDPLHGLRVHTWVLVVSGKRSVPETFFINPLTGNSHSTKDECFLGVESVWNHRNYWVNMQDCRKGCQDLSFDLSDATHWEMMFPDSNRFFELLTKLPERDMDDMPEKEARDLSFDMPQSWVAQIELSSKEYENFYCQGKKVILYKKAKLEKWAPRVNENGLVERLTIYRDLDCTEVVEVREWFKNRADMLDMREVNKQTQLTTDYFSQGHSLHLKAHTYTSLEPETGHTMEFYHEARADDLWKLVESATGMTEYFVGRDDFLHTRHMELGKREKKMDVAGTRTDPGFRPVVQIKEYFHRNPEKPADEDVEERIFMITDESIQLTHYLEDHDIIASKVVFFKATQRDRKGEEIFLTEDMCVKYQPWSSEKHKNVLHLYKMLGELRKEQNCLKQHVWESEVEVLNILNVRENEETNVKLSVSMHNNGNRGKQEKQLAQQKHLSLKVTLLRSPRLDGHLGHD
ncbi:PREDICTED: coiled-coil domain-containing protein lobo homolog [Acanthisitta chloris]|uniref:coiled-coil domain-containing protein lobo homolog n=1 Tax=Acanthisitta chloris TaxID=57068 RepID=UPI0004F0F1E9|nr:PREDICTED: coiled-coil domain-containing protein lobo homolog [Acanthisitta chloris]